MSTAREITRTVTGQRTMDGAGVKLIRVLGHSDVYDIDPFLMLDAFDSENPDDYTKGFPMHPHRGIETITYLIEGRIDHKDSLGNQGSVLSGESQWMTSGNGIMHEEMPQPDKRMWGLQIWLNLAAGDKMTKPAYFDINKDMIKTARIPQGNVRVLSGEFSGVKGVEAPFVKATILDVALNPGQELLIPTDPQANLFVYLLEGSGSFGSRQPQRLASKTAGIFTMGDSLAVRTEDESVRFMIFYARPLREPIAWSGPIVMNTNEELETAFRQLRNGTFVTP